MPVKEAPKQEVRSKSSSPKGRGQRDRKLSQKAKEALTANGAAAANKLGRTKDNRIRKPAPEKKVRGKADKVNERLLLEGQKNARTASTDMLQADKEEPTIEPKKVMARGAQKGNIKPAPQGANEPGPANPRSKKRKANEQEPEENQVTTKRSKNEKTTKAQGKKTQTLKLNLPEKPSKAKVQTLKLKGPRPLTPPREDDAETDNVEERSKKGNGKGSRPEKKR